MTTPFEYRPASAVLEITNRCNLRCPHCASNSGRPRQYEMSVPELFEVIEDLKELGCERLTMLGGEPLLHPQWFEIGKHVNDCGIVLQIITNSLAMNDAVLRKFRELAPEVIGISIDGATRETYMATRGVDKFEFCLKNLWRIRDSGIPAAAITTFSRQNLYDFDRFVELFADRGIIWQIQMANSTGSRFDEEMKLTARDFEFFVDRAIKVKKEFAKRLPLQLTDDFGYFPYERWVPEFDLWEGCPAGRRVIGIRSNGDVLPCLSLGDGFIAGNLLRQTLREVWENSRLMRTFRNKGEILAGRCKTCPRAARCQAGCTASAVTTTGDIGENLYCIRRMEEDKLVEDFAISDDRPAAELRPGGA